MKNAETVTFGGSQLDRAAHHRSELGALRARADSRAILIWQGKVLVSDAGGLVQLPLEQVPVSSGEQIFLGLQEDGSAIFANDLAGWMPKDDDASARAEFIDATRQTHPDIKDAGFAELRSVMTELSVRDAELAATARGIFEWHKSHRFCARCGAPSVAVMGGWQRNCDACGGHHFPRTDPVVIMLITHGNSVLVGRSPGWPDRMFSLLAGFVEPGETMEAAVRREVFEEAGIRVAEVTYLASQPWPFPSSLMFGCAGTAITRDIKIDPAEIEAAMWVTREEMADVFAGQHPTMNPPRTGAIAGFLLEKWLSDCLN